MGKQYGIIRSHDDGVVCHCTALPANEWARWQIRTLFRSMSSAFPEMSSSSRVDGDAGDDDDITSSILLK